MAAAVILAAMSAESENIVHPFFTRATGNPQYTLGELHLSRSVDRGLATRTPDDLPGVATDNPAETNSKRSKVKNLGLGGLAMKQKTLNNVVSLVQSGSSKEASKPPSTSYNGEPIAKRRRRSGPATTEQEAKECQVSGPENCSEDTGSIDKANQSKAMPEISDEPASLPLPVLDTETSQSVQDSLPSGPKTPSRKMLRLKANGRFSSPVSENGGELQRQRLAELPKKRGRPRKSAATSHAPTLIVKVTYCASTDNREAFGKTINRILNGEERLLRKPEHPKKKGTPQQPKPTHPFFLAKPKTDVPPPIKSSPRKASAITPGKLRTQTLSYHSHEFNQPTHDSFGSGLLKDRLMVKHPGAKDPPFPFQGQVHIRGLQEPSMLPRACDEGRAVPFRCRKYKENRLPFPKHESVILHNFSCANSELSSRLRPDGFYDPDPSLHVPQRLILSGDEISHRVSKHLKYPIASCNKALETVSASQTDGHPAVLSLSMKVPTSTTAFDEGVGEAQTWTQKYAPVKAVDVLQSDKEMVVLREWLRSLTIQTVDSGVKKDQKPTAKQVLKPRKKRRKRNDELDDFLVDSDEDAYEMNELEEVADVRAPLQGTSSKSVVQVSHREAKSSNAIMLSGPHGCGKTAAAYAVAREVGFKVFEINPGERRSGKDVIERIGDMAENHLVKHHGTDSAEVSAAEEPSRIDEAFQRDLESGRQGRMVAFFKPQASAKPPAPKKPQLHQVLKTIQKAAKDPPKQQQQSVILLEEVDVLFRDDKDFWAVVLKLIIDSKRPFIMTCNDESIVPLQNISLHAILRFTPPAEDLATDYMLLIGAAEGHILDRDAVLTLYRSKNFDLRACLAQLDFWCQMGIGDPRGGLSWIYQRWPPGSDMDEQGRKLRVVSVGAHRSTMGLLPDVAERSVEHTLQWTWSEFDVEPTIALGWTCPEVLLEKQRERDNSSPSQQFLALDSYAQLADSLSAADVCCALGLPGEVLLDTTTPPVSDKTRGQYTVGHQLLQADECADHSRLSEELFVNFALSAFRASGCSDVHSQGPEAAQLIPYITGEKARSADQPVIGRRAFTCLDAIATSEDSALTTTSTGMVQSVFDGPLAPIALDIAPYVRAVVRFDRALEEQRARIDQLLASDDGSGRRAKRARTTRAARSALEGSQRATTRKERWFTRDLDYDAALATAGEGWQSYAIGTASEASRTGAEGVEDAGSPSVMSAADEDASRGTSGMI